MEPNDPKEQLRRWIGEIEYARYNYVREGIMKCTGITRNAWLRWSRGEGGASVPNMIRIAWYAQTHDMPAPFDTIEITDIQTRNDLVCVIAKVKNAQTDTWETRSCLIL